MNETDYLSVRDTLRLAPVNGQRQGTLFSMPITLDVSQSDIDNLGLKAGARVALRDFRDEAALAIITSEFEPCPLGHAATLVLSVCSRDKCICAYIGRERREY